MLAAERRLPVIPENPVTPVPASSVMVVRQRAGALEVYLTRRRADMRFLGGYTVFPGGRVDPEDVSATAKLAGLNGRCASRLLNLPARLALAHWIAAFRELHEEAGLWLGEGPAPGFDAWHAAAAQLPARRLTYVDHWITPPWVPMRFNTRFFVAVVDGDCAPRPNPAEIDEAWWSRPTDALSDVAAGKVLAIRPTLALLETLAAFGTLTALRARWRGIGRRVRRPEAELYG